MSADNQLVFLIAEDEYNNRLYLDMVLREYASEVIHAETGKQALEKVSERDDISMVFMDLKMPDMDGYEATIKIKMLKPHLPVLAVTAYAMSGDEEKALEAGCDDYLPKPFSTKQILEKLIKFGFVTRPLG